MTIFQIGSGSRSESREAENAEVHMVPMFWSPVDCICTCRVHSFGRRPGGSKDEYAHKEHYQVIIKPYVILDLDVS